MARKSQYMSLSTILGSMLTICTVLHPALGQSALAQQPTQNSARRPIPMSHLYWHFLMYQNHLDSKGASGETTKGQDQGGMGSYAQKRLGFSDADFAPIRSSSVRLTAEVKALDERATATRAVGTPSENYGQLKALTAEREADINSEISYLKQTLSPDKVMRFEAFLNRLYSPTNGAHPPSSSTTQKAPAAVQK
jgi:hypothetical protein